MRRALPLILVAALAAAAPAAAQTDPFTPLPPPAPRATPVPEPADDPGDGDIGRTTMALIGLGVLATFFGIGWAITRDARRSLTEHDRRDVDRRDGAPAPEGSRKARSQVKRKARQKAKAQRASRRRNR